MTSWPISPLAMRYARGFAERNMTAKVRITRPAAPTFSPSSGDVTAQTASTVYEGKARVYPTSGPVQMNLGDEVQWYQNAYVSVPLYVDGKAVLPQIDDLVEVTWHPDELAVGKTYRVMDVEQAGQIPTVRRMQVMGVQRSKQWTPESQWIRKPADSPQSIPPEWIV